MSSRNTALLYQIITIEKEIMATKAVTRVKPTPNPNLNLAEPPMYRVIYINDSVTTMEFVVETLVTIFNHSPETAQEVTLKIHEEGSGIAAILPYEIAEQKGVEVTQLARNNGFPLQIKLEPEE
jgi:ATP-dependent Clp protease adaptor protein ClpS